MWHALAYFTAGMSALLGGVRSSEPSALQAEKEAVLAPWGPSPPNATNHCSTLFFEPSGPVGRASIMQLVHAEPFGTGNCTGLRLPSVIRRAMLSSATAGRAPLAAKNVRTFK
jgi:hypothetical protein